eukprot:TRINITY_DN958_c0_g1_i1.p1 TRINITY_DN958_c0_g1~~TRINITY_DN958_c0_g1_i1.p1  ORF type:complete len:877 (-),score=149.23 TRINITY_DN958_c0_g1_i1:314-2944(-)
MSMRYGDRVGYHQGQVGGGGHRRSGKHRSGQRSGGQRGVAGSGGGWANQERANGLIPNSPSDASLASRDSEPSRGVSGGGTGGGGGGGGATGAVAGGPVAGGGVGVAVGGGPCNVPNAYPYIGGLCPGGSNVGCARADYGGRNEHPPCEGFGYDVGGSSLLVMLLEYVEARDFSNAVKMYGELARGQTSRSLRSDPRLEKSLSRMVNLLKEQDVSIQTKDLADLACALGKLQLTHSQTADVVSDLLRLVGDIAVYRVARFTPHDMAGIVWGFASLVVRNESLMSVIAAEVVDKKKDFDQRHMSYTAWAFAKCGLWNEQLVNAIASECLAKIETFTAQSLSHISWAVAQWAAQQDELMDAIAEEVQKKIKDFFPAPLSMVAWSFASLQVKHTSLMSVISSEATEKISSFRMLDLAHLAWAFANLRIQDHTLFNAMAEEIQHSIKETMPHALANIAWAFSKTNFMHEALMVAIADEATLQIRKFETAEVAMLTWAFAVAGQQNKPLMTEIGSQVAKYIDKYSAPQLSHIAWAFGALSLRHCEFLKSLSMHVHGSVDRFKSGGLSNIVWSFAMVTFRDEPFLRLVAPEIARESSGLRPLALTRCAWAYSALAVRIPELVAALSAEALNKLDDFPTKALVKLIDAIYMSPSAQYMPLERALAERIMEVANFLRVVWPSRIVLEEADVEAYSKQLLDFGLIDFGIVGTPLLLTQLGIQLPGRDFIQRCRKQAWLEHSSQDSQARRIQDTSVRRGFTAAELEVTFMEEAKHDWVVRDQRGCENSYDPGGPEDANLYFYAATLPGRHGRAESTFAVLVESCAIIASMGVDLNSASQCARVSGYIQIIALVVPCISTVGALKQFAVMFPGVALEFGEQVGDNCD